MDKLLERYLKKIKIDNIEPFKDSYFDKLSSDSEANKVILTLHSKTILPYSSYVDLFKKIEELEQSSNGFKTLISFAYNDAFVGLDDFIDQYISENDMYELGDYSINKNNKLIVITYTEDQYEICSMDSEKLNSFLEEINIDFKCALVEREEDQVEEDESYKEETTPLPVVKERVKVSSKKITSDISNNKYVKVQLKDIDKLNKVEVEGKIFKVGEIRTTKKGKVFVDFEYTDYTNSIGSTIFESKKFDKAFIKSLVPGIKIKVKGEVGEDEYKHRLVIFPDSIDILPNDPPREDLSPAKRVELHCHTNLSAMDGVSNITEYASLAKNFGMKALGVTDHGVVQAFPYAEKAAKANNLKMLYGCELYMVDSHLNIVLNPKDTVLYQVEYVIFDLETTGLSARYDRIIEFGATKYYKGQVIDKVDFFINPDRKLRQVIIDKTHITQSMVDSGKPIKQALKDILEFFGDSVIIDHNAAFDIGFLNEALKNNGLPQIENSVIDTLPLSRYMYPNRRSHSLESIARLLNIDYDETKVHRAIYDAEVLQQVYLGLLSVLAKNNSNLNMMDLINLTSNDVVKTARPKHVVVYAKNSQGLKDLYKIISISCTDYLTDIPHTPRWLIEENRKNLLVGSGCFNGEVFEAALTKSSDVLKETMKFYDYIEVQPPECYSWLINDGQISSKDNLLMIIKDLITAAKEINKTVVATSDCHYANPEEKVYRDVYIFSKGIKGALHPLNPIRRSKQEPYENPDQHFLSTQEMKDAFKFLNDDKLVEEIVVTNTNLIADSIDNIRISKDKLYTPNIKDCDKKLTELCYKNAKEMYGEPLPEVIEKRLEDELNGILGNGYEVIYWFAHLLVAEVNKSDHLVGSRGSVGSSFVATMAKITEVNPLPPYWLCKKCKNLIWADVKIYFDGYDLPDRNCEKCGTKMVKDGHNIPFATFLGFHAEKVPDIDLNFPSDFQSKAHEITKKLLGADNCFKAGTIQSVEEKNAIGYVKGYFENRGIDPKTIRPAEIDRLASGCIGVKKTTGQHPGGIIVIPSDMDVLDFTPYQYPANDSDSSWKTTHFEYKTIHDNVLKFDELGHVDPYAIKMMCDMAHIKIEDIPLDDPETMSLFYSTKALRLQKNYLKLTNGALGLPEFGTKLGRKILEETQPRGFGDLVRIEGLSHGTNVFAGNAEDMILSGKATLRDVIGCRDDVMTQLNERWNVPLDKAFNIMEYVRHGYYPKEEKVEKGEEYLKMMKDYNVDENYIESCKKIAYLFPKGHAVAYAMMAVRVAWFKVHYPEIFYAVYYTLRCGGQYNLMVMQRGLKAVIDWVNKYINNSNNNPHLISEKDKQVYETLTTYIEMADRNIKFGKISIKNSDSIMFTVDPITKDIIPPFIAVDSLGETVAKQIVNERDKRPYNSIEDFENRGGVSTAISSNLQNLGAYDDMPKSSQMTLDEFLS